ncbi:MAG: alpha/beta hydrolase, partial [Marinosulfonomonas sp.]|nr:alpha/beta hydrolase [Marinosulfonomonas sp.]
FSSLMYSPENRIPDLVAIRQAIYRQPEMKAAMNHILCLQDPDVRARNNIAEDEWKSIQAPTLVYVAPDDSEAFYNTALRAKDMIPNAQSVEMYGVKHWPHFEKPDEFNPVSIEFLLGKG